MHRFFVSQSKSSLANLRVYIRNIGKSGFSIRRQSVPNVLQYVNKIVTGDVNKPNWSKFSYKYGIYWINNVAKVVHTIKITMWFLFVEFHSCKSKLHQPISPAVPGPGGTWNRTEAFLHTGIGLKCFVLLKMKEDVPSYKTNWQPPI